MFTFFTVYPNYHYHVAVNFLSVIAVRSNIHSQSVKCLFRSDMYILQDLSPETTEYIGHKSGLKSFLIKLKNVCSLGNYSPIKYKLYSVDGLLWDNIPQLWKSDFSQNVTLVILTTTDTNVVKISNFLEPDDVFFLAVFIFSLILGKEPLNKPRLQELWSRLGLRYAHFVLD